MLRRWIFLLTLFVSMALTATAAAFDLAITWPKFHAWDDNGAPCSGCKVNTYQSGTTTPLTTYSDRGLTTPNQNPVVLDSRGEALIYCRELLKVVITDANDVPLSGGTVDNLKPSDSRTLSDDDVDTTVEVERTADDDTIRFKAAGQDQIIMQDGKMEPVTDNDVELGSLTKRFKTGHIVEPSIDRVMVKEQSSDPSTAANTGALYGKDVGGKTHLFYRQDSDGTVQDLTFVIPTGGIVAWVTATAPTGWFECNGSAKSMTSYEVLYNVIGNDYGMNTGTTFTATPATDIITSNSHGLSEDDIIELTNWSGALPAGLNANTKYYVIYLSTDTFQVGTTPTGSAVDITDTGTGTHLWHNQFRVPDLRAQFIRGFTNISDKTINNTVDTGNDRITVTSHGFFRDGVPVRFTTTGSLPAGLAINTTYYERVIDDNTIELYDTEAHARDRSATTGRVDLTGNGSGTNTIKQWMDPDAGSRTDRGDSTTGDNVGTRQADQFESHTHSALDGGYADAASGSGTYTATALISGATGGNETRPTNVGMMYIIKY